MSSEYIVIVVILIIVCLFIQKTNEPLSNVPSPQNIYAHFKNMGITPSDNDTLISEIIFLNPTSNGSWDTALNIAEVMIYDVNKQKIALDCSPEDPKQNISGTIANYNDINETNIPYGKCNYITDNNLYSFHHSLPDKGSYVSLKLKNPTPLGNIVYIYVRNRFDKGDRHRLSGTVMYVLGPNEKVIKRFTLTSELNQYFPFNLNSGGLHFEKTTLININKPGGGYINLAGLKVYDIDGNLLGVNSYRHIKSDVMVFNSRQGPVNNLFDNDDNTIYHSSGNNNTTKLSLQLVKPAVIAKVIVTNRSDCCYDRAVGIVISLYGESGSNPIDNLVLTDARRERSFYPQLILK